MPRITDNLTDNRKIYGERAKRVRTIRGMLHMTYEEFGKFAGNYTPTSVNKWENSPVAGLTEKAARNIIQVLQNTSVVCSLNWLLHGKGLPPYIRSDDSMLAKYQQELASLSHKIDPETYMQNEIERFASFVDKAITMIVQDHSMAPMLALGDTVGGEILEGQEINKALNTFCIVRLTNGALLPRKILADKENPGKYQLICLNTADIAEPISNNISVQYAAPITHIWRKKRYS